MGGTLKVALDITETLASEPTGCAIYTARLVEALLAMQQAGSTSPACSCWVRSSHAGKLDVCCCNAGVPIQSLPRWSHMMLGHADIIHGFATHAPALGRARRIVTLFDVFSALPSSAEWQEPRSRRRKKRQYRALARTCRHVIAISEATRRDFVQFTGYPEERIDVVYGGISSNYTPGAAGRRAELVKQYSLPERYAFYLGAPVARKNVNRLIEAYAQSGITGEIDLVIGGSTTAGTEPLMALARDLAIADRVHFIGYVREEDKPGLYACAEAFLFPTFYEGLGLPLLEAMACGTPVMAGNRGAAPEIVSKYGVIVNPYDTRGIAAGIGEVVGMGAAVEAVPYAQAFTWQRCAEETVAVYERVMAANSNEWMRAQ